MSIYCTPNGRIWITGFDELGLWPIIDTGIADFGIRNRASACAPATGECYQQWPCNPYALNSILL